MKTSELLAIKTYLEGNGFKIVSADSKMQLRKDGKEFSLPEHIEGMVFSLLSAQTVWANIERNRQNIIRLFFNFDPAEIKKKDAAYFYEGLGRWGCRGRLTKAQMGALHYNIGVMETIIAKYGSMDRFLTEGSLVETIDKLANPKSPYKLKYMATALVCEYLRNIGIDCFKPDVHLTRFFGCDRMAITRQKEASFEELYREIKKLSRDTGLWMAEIDYIIWAYCATDYGEICCATPKCSSCVIKESCKMMQKA